MRYLLDEHSAPTHHVQLLRAAPELEVWIVGDPGAPPRGTRDPAILIWCEKHHILLVTNNRKSMPRHLVDYLALGRHSPGILVINPALPIGELIDELVFITGASDEHEYCGLILYLPLA